MKNSISISKEDYLKAALEAECEGQTVISATLAHWLGVSPPAVSMALRRLKRDGYVDVKPDGIVRLTPKGRHAARRTALRHHLIERMLSEMFGMPWYEVHDEAERLEHAVSPPSRPGCSKNWVSRAPVRTATRSGRKAPPAAPAAAFCAWRTAKSG